MTFPEMEMCIEFNDPFMCMVWGDMWGNEMSDAMNDAGISYIDMMDALAVHSDNEALSILYEYMGFPEMEMCIEFNDSFMCMMWGDMWGNEMSDVMYDAGISYFDMMDAGYSHRLAPLHGVTKRASILEQRLSFQVLLLAHTQLL